ncbi:MAG: GatB/YqeY domain-containing protein [Pseudomonadales bacterium]
MAAPIKARVEAEVKAAMKARDKPRLAALRLMMAEFKRVEVDERIDLDDPRCLALLDKMTKQRKDSLAQYEQAGRDDLAARESLELAIIAEFLPQQLAADELKSLVAAAVADAGASSMQDMGKVMGLLKPQVQGRADMQEVSAQVKAALS